MFWLSHSCHIWKSRPPSCDGRTKPGCRIRIALDELDREIGHSLEIVRADDATMSSAIHLTRLHRLRAADAIQLACALAVHRQRPELIFVSSDVELNRAAGAERLSVLDPAQP
jgi:predicted nucleic acid-binding protein